MPTLRTICGYLEAFAPPVLAESWDNVGLLAGDPAVEVARVMTCLTISPTTAREAVERRADLVVSHHPLPFHPLRRIVTDATAGRLLWELITHRVAIYSPHTSFDSAARGINQRLAEGMGLLEIRPLVSPVEAPPETGGGRQGRLPAPMTLDAVGHRLKQFLSLDHLQCVGQLDTPIARVAVACGAAGEYLASADAAGCELLVLGETNLHTCLEAEARGVALLLTGHFASERFALDCLADLLSREFPSVEVWASLTERDPVAWL